MISNINSINVYIRLNRIKKQSYLESAMKQNIYNKRKKNNIREHKRHPKKENKQNKKDYAK